MNNNIDRKQFKWLSLIKWGFTVLALGFLYYEIFVRNDLSALLRDYRSKLGGNAWPLLGVLVLMPFNWFIDALKWRWLLKESVVLTYSQAIKGVFMGLSVGLFTPNGVGEFAGRMLTVRNACRQQAVAASIAGSLAQLAITITVGGACIVFFMSKYVMPDYVTVAQITAVITVVVGFYTYFKLPVIAEKLFSRIPSMSRFSRFREALSNYSNRELLAAYGFAFLRYAVFCTQLGIILFALGGIDIFEQYSLILLIPVYYYIQTLVPTVALSEVGVRGMILSVLYSGYLVQSDVLLASFVIWVVNLIIPGLMGLVLVWETKLDRP
ncbi:MAG: hypothetical protein JJ975_17450 [Bacteroidia bacterium]|nr:hypothetical protein [Bacteroidia bacterium]